MYTCGPCKVHIFLVCMHRLIIVQKNEHKYKGHLHIIRRSLWRWIPMSNFFLVLIKQYCFNGGLSIWNKFMFILRVSFDTVWKQTKGKSSLGFWNSLHFFIYIFFQTLILCLVQGSNVSDKIPRKHFYQTQIYFKRPESDCKLWTVFIWTSCTKMRIISFV